MVFPRFCCLIAVCLILCVGSAHANELPADGRFTATDSLARKLDNETDDVRACLEGLAWEPGSFAVRCAPAKEAPYDWLVRFPSPVPGDQQANNLVALEWYVARDDNAQPINAPAVIVVHESGSGMHAGRLFARSLRANRLHALMIHLPYYGVRRGKGLPARPDVVTIFRQGVADIRRARDAVAVLPHIQADNINVQGTSLGGFAAALAASLDGAFDHTFLVLAGGQLHELVMNGEKDTAKFRQRLLDHGYTEPEIKQLLWRIEPTRIAHRLDPANTWLYSARGDRVVPHKHSAALASAARLTNGHHLLYPGNHYTVFVYLPKVMDHIVTHIRQ